MPGDTKANDPMALARQLVTRISGVTDRLRKAVHEFHHAGRGGYSRRPKLNSGSKAVMVRDPNGHAIRLIEE
jgi:hypothetical protein